MRPAKRPPGGAGPAMERIRPHKSPKSPLPEARPIEQPLMRPLAPTEKLIEALPSPVTPASAWAISL